MNQNNFLVLKPLPAVPRASLCPCYLNDVLCSIKVQNGFFRALELTVSVNNHLDSNQPLSNAENLST